MEFVFGAVMMFVSLIMLALVGRALSGRLGSGEERGEIVPAMVAVFFTVLMTISLAVMMVGGEAYSISIWLELAIILPLTILGACIATRLSGTVKPVTMIH